MVLNLSWGVGSEVRRCCVGDDVCRAKCAQSIHNQCCRGGPAVRKERKARDTSDSFHIWFQTSLIAEFVANFFQGSSIQSHDPTWDHNLQLKRPEFRPGPCMEKVLDLHALSEHINSVPLIFYLLWPILAFKALKMLPVLSQSVRGNLWTVLFSSPTLPC